jgi:hypothetical protein
LGYLHEGEVEAKFKDGEEKALGEERAQTIAEPLECQ